jgi:ABC-type glycerol-3-phosphate transport system permease component
MKKTEEKSSHSAEGLYKFFIYFVLILLAVTIIVPVAWVFMASIKQNSEFYGNPWALPAGFYWQNFVNAWNGAKMGDLRVGCRWLPIRFNRGRASVARGLIITDQIKKKENANGYPQNQEAD